MILDHIARTEFYLPLGGRVRRAFELLANPELLARPDGRYEIEGPSLVVILQQYTSKPVEQARWESHRRYIDVQYMLSGVELMGWAWRPTMAPAGDYDEAKDIIFYTDPGGALGIPTTLLPLTAGMFAIFGPDDVHLPGVALGRPAPVRKAVFKVAVP
jgi:YhcH/YjgK/YiaL family protein